MASVVRERMGSCRGQVVAESLMAPLPMGARRELVEHVQEARLPGGDWSDRTRRWTGF